MYVHWNMHTIALSYCDGVECKLHVLEFFMKLEFMEETADFSKTPYLDLWSCNAI